MSEPRSTGATAVAADVLRTIGRTLLRAAVYLGSLLLAAVVYIAKLSADAVAAVRALMFRRAQARDSRSIFGFRGSAWGKLAQRYPVRQRYSGGWTGCPTLHVSNVSAADPEYDRNKVRFVGMVRLACGDDAIFLAPLLSVFNVLMPPVQIPPSAITKVKTYEHAGHVQAPRDPGTLLQITYDPNFQGRIAELTIGDAPVYLQMQADLLEPVLARLPIDEEPNRAARA